MKRLLEFKRGRWAQIGSVFSAESARYVCRECNTLLPENQIRSRSSFTKRCPKGHLLTPLRPFQVSFCQGLGVGTLIMGGAATLIVLVGGEQFAVIGAAGAISSALACKRMLDGLAYLKLNEPAKWLGRQLFSQAVGIWLAILLSSFLSAT